MEVVKFQDKLIIKDSIRQNKILFFYNLRESICIKSTQKEISLNKDEFAVAIARDKYELEIIPSTNENCIVWGKITL